MAVQASDLKFRLPALLPTDDTSASGGAAEAAGRPLDSQLTANAQVAMVSDNAADTMNVTLITRAPDGSERTETKALNGTTEVLFTANDDERIVDISLASAAAGTVQIKQGTGGTVRHTFAPGETHAAILFRRAGSVAGSPEVRYEALFAENDNDVDSLLSPAEVTLTDDPDAKYQMGLAAAKDDSTQVANRKTAPAGVTFVDDDTAQTIPGDTLGPNERIKVWIQQTLAAGAAPAKSTFTLQSSGQTA